MAASQESRSGGSGSRGGFGIAVAMIFMLSVPAALTLHTVRLAPTVDPTVKEPSPYGYTVSLLLFLVPIVGIGFWFVPQEGVRISKKAFWSTIAVLFPLGAALDFFFAHMFFEFPNRSATLGVTAPALGGGVPVEEYAFYLLGFIVVLLMYIWLDEYWLNAYTVPGESEERIGFGRLLRFHPLSAVLAVVLIAAAIMYKRFLSPEPEGFPGYFTFLVLLALTPAAGLFPEARGVINWRAFSLTFFVILLTSLLWEATLAVPYGWWGYQGRQMMGLRVTAWSGLPIEAVAVWLAVTFATVVVYEIVKRWKGSGRTARAAFLGRR